MLNKRQSMRYYNKTNKDIPYISTDFIDYLNKHVMKPGNYFATPPIYTKKYVISNWGSITVFFRREDFNKLTKIK